MFSLSTSWNARKHSTGRAIIEEITCAGFDAVELSFALTENIVEDIISIKDRDGIRISSLHNMCPLPPEIAAESASPDYYSLSSPHEAERRAAVAAAKKTLTCAKRCGARAVVLHAGRVQIKDRTRDLAAFRDDPRRFASLRDDMIRQRLENSGGYFDNTVRSLDELVSFAKNLEVALGVENRYYYSEIPTADEFEALFRLFKPGELYYWHDVGHAEVFDRLGLASHIELLKRFSGRLIGIHLHDIIGPTTDHQSPGNGTFDFGIIRPYIKKDTIMVMEVHAPATADDLRRGRDHLKKILHYR